MKGVSKRCTWKDLDMMQIERGVLRLKYPRCTLIEQHLFPSQPLGKALRAAALRLREDYGIKSLSLQGVSKYATLDGLDVSKLIQILWNGRAHRRQVERRGRIKREDIKGICRTVMRKLGPAHTEQVYELALCQELYNRGVPHIRQMPVTTRYSGDTSIPAGIIDIEVDHRFLLELKSGTYNDRHRQQLSRYMSAMRSNGKRVEAGLVVCFQSDGNVSFRAA